MMILIRILCKVWRWPSPSTIWIVRINRHWERGLLCLLKQFPYIPSFKVLLLQVSIFFWLLVPMNYWTGNKQLRWTLLAMLSGQKIVWMCRLQVATHQYFNFDSYRTLHNSSSVSRYLCVTSTKASQMAQFNEKLGHSFRPFPWNLKRKEYLVVKSSIQLCFLF